MTRGLAKQQAKEKAAKKLAKVTCAVPETYGFRFQELLSMTKRRPAKRN